VAVRKARDFAARNPQDHEGQVNLWRESLDAAAGTPYSAEARREMEGALARRRDAISKHWAEIQEQVKVFVAKQQVQAAIELLQSARSRYSAPDWTQPLDRKLGELHRTLAPPPAPPPSPAPPGPRPGKVVLAHDFLPGPGPFNNVGDGAPAPAEIVNAEPNGTKAIAIPPKGSSVRGFQVVTRPSTVVRFRLKSMIDLDFFECMSFIESKQANAWFHVTNLKKGEWRTVEFKLGDLALNYNGTPIMGESVNSLVFYYINRPDDARILLTDFEIRD